jgi:ketosteroid isomerase-like protein
MSQALVEKFYRAFQARDGAAMTLCYHANAQFSDPGFPHLKGAEVGAMWRMLTSRAQKFSLEFDRVEVRGDQGSAHWVARYEFSGTGRMVENHIRSEFVFKDGLIIQQSDYFDFWKWSAQALGLPGRLLGWSGLFRRKVQAQAAKNLQGFMAKERK